MISNLFFIKNNIKMSIGSFYTNLIYLDKINKKLYVAVEDSKPKLVLKYLQNGANPNYKNGECLRIAYFNNDIKSLKHLLEYGANPFLKKDDPNDVLESLIQMVIEDGDEKILSICIPHIDLYTSREIIKSYVKRSLNPYKMKKTLEQHGFIYFYVSEGQHLVY